MQLTWGYRQREAGPRFPEISFSSAPSGAKGRSWEKSTPRPPSILEPNVLTMRDHPRILVGTLYSGENEFEQCVASLQAQSYVHWEHSVHEKLGNKEAHETLYREFMNRSDEFDLFVKLDADMVFADSDGLAKIVTLFRETPELDHLQMVVHDWYSNSLIMGVHVFSGRVTWLFSEENLFVDYPPVIQGVRWRLWDAPAPLVVHSPDPSPLQAFRFGVHRALKALQPSRRVFRIDHSKVQWAILKKVWTHFAEAADRRLGLVIMGAEQVFSGTAKLAHYDLVGEDVMQIYAPCADLSVDELYVRLRPHWERAVVREFRYTSRIASCLCQTLPPRIRSRSSRIVRGAPGRMGRLFKDMMSK